MPQARSPEQVRREQAEVAIDDAYAIREEYQRFLQRRRANRQELRNLAQQGYLTEEQLTEVEDLYPARKVAEQEQEEAAA